MVAVARRDVPLLVVAVVHRTVPLHVEVDAQNHAELDVTPIVPRHVG